MVELARLLYDSNAGDNRRHLTKGEYLKECETIFPRESISATGKVPLWQIFLCMCQLAHLHDPATLEAHNVVMLADTHDLDLLFKPAAVGSKRAGNLCWVQELDGHLSCTIKHTLVNLQMHTSLHE